MDSNARVIESIYDLINLNSYSLKDQPVFLSPDKSPLSWKALTSQLEYVGKAFKSLGVINSDRVAVVLPDGPELAVAFLTMSSCATFAPLNPSYRDEDFEFYFKDLAAKAVVLPEGSDSPARAVAKRLGIQILDMIVAEDGASGEFSFNIEMPPSAEEILGSCADDIALVLHTSGTTSRPKQVPLSHRNLCASAKNIGNTLGLNSSDVSLCVMPLFHIHGLIGALLSAVYSGGRVVCTPGFNAGSFFGWLESFKPSWYSAVPTMHQAILAIVSQSPELAKSNSLRFIRSSSSALPPIVMEKLEASLAVPIIESYGMTEAAHQMASNPLPPQARKAGSVGLAAGPELTILDSNGLELQQGKTGEVCIRGKNVTKGYANNPEANSTAFCDGWFRTGDQGYFDEEGYLFLTGRLKEIINRGGEKISPREIDEVLLTYSNVKQAVAFAATHPTLGEDIVAAVILKVAEETSEAQLREYALDRLPAFKVPTRILIVDDIPKGPTGKIQRIGMATRLASFLEVPYEAPKSEMEQLVSKNISEVLGADKVGLNDNFFSLGGDSLRATQLLSRLQSALAIQIPVPTIFRFPTASQLANKLELIKNDEIEALAIDLEKLSPEELEKYLGDL